MKKRIFPIAVLAALLFGVALLPRGVSADGNAADNIINNEYGATRAIDNIGNDDPVGDSESCSTVDANRGNLMEFHAYNDDANDAWYLAFVTDSSQALNDTTGNFFGKGSGDLVTYLIGLDVGCDGGSAMDQNGPPSGPWSRFFSWGADGVDYWVPMFSTGADTMTGQVWQGSHPNKKLVGQDFPITSRTVDFRRHVELTLADVTWVNDADGLAAQTALTSNTEMCALIVSTVAKDDWDGDGNTGEFDGGRVIDAVGTNAQPTYDYGNPGSNRQCSGIAGYLTFGAGEYVATQQNCQDSGRPMLGGTFTRHCTSNQARSAITEISGGETCGAPLNGLAIDGNTEAAYTVLDEVNYAAPYQGGSPTNSDFNGESSSFQYWDGTNILNYAGNADVQDVRVYTDAYFLYVDVSGPGLTAFGGLGEMAGQPADDANLFIAIDMPTTTSNTDTGDHGGGPEVYTPPDAAAGVDAPLHPSNRPINFRGWDPDYIVEMIWAGDDGTTDNVQIWSYGGASWTVDNTFTTVETAGTSPSGSVPFNTNWHNGGPAPAADDLYFGRQPTSYEFAIPWKALGINPADPHPATGLDIKLGVYTARNPDGWDTNDQAPGIGQGANGLGSHERIGDLPDENDNEDDASAAGNDQTPFVGRSHGQGNRKPASDNTSGDSDTIEAYFLFNPDSVLVECDPVAVELASFTAEVSATGAVELRWETAAEWDHAGFNVYRSSVPTFNATWATQINASLIAAQGSLGQGASYAATDSDVAPGVWYYFLEDIDTSGTSTVHGPVLVDTQQPTSASLSALDGAAPSLPVLIAVVGGLLLLVAAATGRRQRVR